ncbi:hypothetical protein IQ227_07270 [Anabaena aphanizomenioides LEGE 00250]|uniref:Uncharacterized protein n=1 Tax=Sphaerospermopsis aphanizomenoides LEGE 00250 TaxID=2777972 RepID=A0ABR9VBH7_9CYAN|nr:hypothetical protein [Sphaerospermopsis aphanizomenoides]MBE9235841.1 hypothetical protein [Sphaerospermopsis aphanizomenoides LEGE 00250]
MKINPIIALIIGAGIGSGATYLLIPKSSNFTETTAIQPVATSSGTDEYEIRWYGKPKNEFWGGSYTIIKPDSPMEVIKVPKSPHVVRIKLPKQSTVGAAGDVQDVKIFRNGKECGRDGVIGEGIPINKACTPDL